jgi:hypothetical protein
MANNILDKDYNTVYSEGYDEGYNNGYAAAKDRIEELERSLDRITELQPSKSYFEMQNSILETKLLLLQDKFEEFEKKLNKE